MTDAALRKTISRRLREAREAKGLSQTSVADKLGIKAVNISRMESGKYCPSASNIFRLCRILDILPNWLFGLDEGK
jgi:transcriptional regulator with XRE-family HTH domain